MTEKSAKYFFKGFPQDLSKQSVIKQQVGNNQQVGGRKWQSGCKEVFRPRYANESFEPISFWVKTQLQQVRDESWGRRS